jgi:rod shape-determining protein MreC
MLRQPRVIIIALFVLFGMVALSLPARTSSHLKLIITSLFLPFFGLSSAAHGMSEQAMHSAVSRRVLLRQMEELRRENDALRIQLLQAEEVTKENTRLRQLVGLDPRLSWKHQMARVVGRDPANWWRGVIIDKGSTDGIRTNLPVITQDGLAGRVDRVGLKQSWVVLVGDPACQVSAVVAETRDQGIVTPATPAALDYGVAALTHLPRNNGIKPGQRVVTSGQGPIFPQGIPVGEVQEVHGVEYGLYTEARIRLLARLNCLEEVWIIHP